MTAPIPEEEDAEEEEAGIDSKQREIPPSSTTLHSVGHLLSHCHGSQSAMERGTRKASDSGVIEKSARTLEPEEHQATLTEQVHVSAPSSSQKGKPEVTLAGRTWTIEYLSEPLSTSVPRCQL